MEHKPSKEEILASRKKAIFLFLVVSTFCLGFLAAKSTPMVKSFLFKQVNKWDLTGHSEWEDGFRLVKVKSSADGSLQNAYFLDSSSEKPLLVSLHTWSGDFSQTDPLAKLAEKHGWNYIHPDFRGPNWTESACLSPLVISDIDDSIEYAIKNSKVDVNNIFVVGVSGGGYTTLGYYLRARHKIRRFVSWVPISDLSAWYHQSLSLGNDKYAENIAACTSSLDADEAKSRSPLYWKIPEDGNGGIDIYAGINDGHKGGGSVPISHSILFFNRLVNEKGLGDKQVGEEKIIELLTRASSISPNSVLIGDRAVFYKSETPEATLTIFDGRHEMLPEYTFNRLVELSKGSSIK